jgi:NAD(P)H-dependent FMN reductase
VLAKASGRAGADYGLVDLADHPRPHLDEPLSPTLGQYVGDHTKAWAATIRPYDGFFVTPEYNHSTSGVTSGVLKNAIDYLYAEWNINAATKGPGSRAAGIAMAYKLIDAAQARWRAVNAPHLVALVRAGATFHKGKLLERPVDITPETSDAEPSNAGSEVA